MKTSLEVKKVNSILSISGLILLLLLSPCKVRNYIQAESGVPQTRLLNKNQSTISQSNCQILKAYQTVSKPTIQQPDFTISEAYSFELIINPLKYSYTERLSRSQQVSNVPLYILYQIFLIYS